MGHSLCETDQLREKGRRGHVPKLCVKHLDVDERMVGPE